MPEPLTLTRREVVASPTGAHPLSSQTEHTDTDHTDRKARAC